jgi:hypothetical protein
MPAFLFCVLSLPHGREIRRMTVSAADERDAVGKVHHMALLLSTEAVIGKTGRVVYPRGVLGGEAWVLLRLE